MNTVATIHVPLKLKTKKPDTFNNNYRPTYSDNYVGKDDHKIIEYFQTYYKKYCDLNDTNTENYNKVKEKTRFAFIRATSGF